MTFLKEHFDHVLLVILGILGGAAGVWCDLHHLADSSKWMYAEAAAALAALLMRMNSNRNVQPNPPPETK
jgi:hypothetical protein